MVVTVETFWSCRMCWSIPYFCAAFGTIGPSVPLMHYSQWTPWTESHLLPRACYINPTLMRTLAFVLTGERQRTVAERVRGRVVKKALE